MTVGVRSEQGKEHQGAQKRKVYKDGNVGVFRRCRVEEVAEHHLQYNNKSKHIHHHINRKNMKEKKHHQLSSMAITIQGENIETAETHHRNVRINVKETML